MDNPLAPPPITPGIRTPRVTRASRDRKGKGRSFRDELAGKRDGPPEPRPAAAEPDAAKGRRHPKDEPGHLLDIEA